MKRTIDPSGQGEPFPIRASSLCKQVSPRKGETITLLDNVEFTASWRAMTGIIGPSGSGKSTLLYCLAGLEPVSSGQVEVLGRRIFADEPTGALDQETGNAVVNELAAFANRPGHAVIVVTHSPEVASRCNTLVHLCDGRIATADKVSMPKAGI